MYRDITMNGRLRWLDNTKALGMFLVFWGHFIEKNANENHWLLQQVCKAIYSFHMPLFFVLAGFLFHAKPQLRFGAYCALKYRTRLVPVLFFVTLSVFLYMVSIPVPASWEVPHNSSMLDIHIWFLLQGKPVMNWPCWFLVCLFFVEIFAHELIIGIKRQAFILISLPALYWLAYTVNANLAQVTNLLGIIDQAWFLQESMMALFFYLCGYMLSKYGRTVLPTQVGMHSKVIFLISATVLLCTYNLNYSGSANHVNMSVSDHGDWAWFLITALAGTLACMHLGGLIPVNAFFNQVGALTLPLLGINGVMINFVNPGLWHVLATVTNESVLLIATFIATLATLLIALPIAYMLNKWLPFLVGGWK